MVAMSSITANIRLRPIRFAFLIKPDDRKNLSKIFEINTCLWGGAYNPIIPYFKRIPKWWSRDRLRLDTAKGIVRGYLEFFEPDFVVEAEVGLANDCFAIEDSDTENRILSIDDILPRVGGARDEGYGLDVNNLYRYLYDKEFKFQHRRDQNVVSCEPKNVKMNDFSACVFGSFPKQRDLGYFELNYNEAFAPTRINFDGKSLNRLYREGFVSPLGIGCENIEVRHEALYEFILFIMDATKPIDLIDYWNLRSTERDVMAVPIQFMGELSDLCKKIILEHYEATINASQSTMPNVTALFSRSISGDSIDEIMRCHMRVGKKGALVRKDWIPPLWRKTPNGFVRKTRPILDVKSKEIDTPVNSDHAWFQFKNLSPKFAENYGSKYRWANIVNFSNYGSSNTVATVFPCNGNSHKFTHLSRGIEKIICSTEGITIFPWGKNSQEFITLDKHSDEICSWFRDNQITATPSDAGKIPNQIIDTFGGASGVRFLANFGVVKTLDQLAISASKNMLADTFRNKINAETDNDFRHRFLFNVLVKRKIVELGINAKCSKCGKWTWYSISQIDYKNLCGFCRKEFEFPIENPNKSGFAKWSYRVVGPFALPDYAEGGYSVALAIRFFADVLGGMSGGQITWSSGLDIELESGEKYEIDFTIWSQKDNSIYGMAHPTRVIFGEAKSFSHFKKEDIDKMQRMATLFPGSVLVFSSMKENLSSNEIKLLRKVSNWGRESDKLTGQSRAIVIVLLQTELFSIDNITATWEKKGGVYEYFSKWIRSSDIEGFAEATQQIYLGMPSYSEWYQNKYSKKRAKK